MQPQRTPTRQTSAAPGPQLVARHPAAERRYSALALWHLLSLDAPTVAAVWTAFLAHCCGIALPWTATAAMFLAVWMIYAADRLLDARMIDTVAETQRSPDFVVEGLALEGLLLEGLEERHRFHYRHRGRFSVLLMLAALILAALLPQLNTHALMLYSLLATLLAAWMLIIHVRPVSSARTKRLPKEFAVGVFFAAAVFIPSIARAPELRSSLLPVAILFAAVCSLNCLFLYAWENSTMSRSAHWTTHSALRHVSELAWMLTVAGAALGFRHGPARAPALACALGAMLLLLLHTQRHRLSALHLRAAADVALLTPLALWPLVSRLR